VGRQSLSFFQSVIGLVAGLTSIMGGVYSAVHYFKPTPVAGEMIALVRDERTARPVQGATIEILTPQGALVTTLAAADDGVARRSLRQGTYRLRVSHPLFSEERRDIQILPGDTTEVRLQLAASGEEWRADATRADAASTSARRRDARVSPVDGAARVVHRSVDATRRLLGRLGL
jgi:hypothetical protein